MDGVLREVLRQALRPHGTHRAAGTSQEVPDAEPPWSPEQWNEAFSYLFLAAPGSRHAVLEHQDDMLWFVTAAGALATGTAPVTLRRNVSASLPPELRPGGRDFGTVDWAASVQLNLVVQATYVLTVVQCEEMALAAVAQAGNTTPGTYSAHLHERAAGRATPSGDSAHTSTSASTGSSIPGTVVAQRRVFASPMSADVNLEDAKAGRPPAACYPDVSFSVDNFESGFEDMVLSQTGDCYCVMLHVHAAATSSAQPPTPLPSDAAGASQPSTCHNPSKDSGTAAGRHERRATLFSAYVTREQVAAYIATKLPPPSKPSLLNRLLGSPVATGSNSGAGSQLLGRRERVVMSGPAGVGRAEALAVIVTPPGAPPVINAPASAGAGIATAAGGAPGPRGGGTAPQALQMSLMWMSLPASALARAVLHFACESL